MSRGDGPLYSFYCRTILLWCGNYFTIVIKLTLFLVLLADGERIKLV